MRTMEEMISIVSYYRVGDATLLAEFTIEEMEAWLDYCKNIANSSSYWLVDLHSVEFKKEISRRLRDIKIDDICG